MFQMSPYRWTICCNCCKAQTRMNSRLQRMFVLIIMILLAVQRRSRKQNKMATHAIFPHRQLQNSEKLLIIKRMFLRGHTIFESRDLRKYSEPLSPPMKLLMNDGQKKSIHSVGSGSECENIARRIE